MSIINQALKKAQREQLLHEAPLQPYILHRPSPRTSLRWFIGVGCFVILGVTTMRYGWFSTPPLPTEKQQHQRIARQASAPILPQPNVSPPTPAVSVPAPPASAAAGPMPTPVPMTPADMPASAIPRPARPTPETTPEDHNTTSIRHLPQPGSPPLPTPRVTASATPLAPSPAPAPPRAQALFQQAADLQERGQQTLAIALLQEAVDLDATFKEAYNRLGNLYYKRQSYRQALDSFQKAIAIDPDDVKARNNLGSTYLRLDLDEQARDVLHQAIDIDPTYGLAYYNLACAYARTGDASNTVQYLKHAITIEPQARDWAQTDDDFRPVRNTPELRQLLGTTSW